MEVVNALNFFPEGYTPRKEQEDAIEQIVAQFDAGKRIVALEAPTGSGKSFVAQTIARREVALGGRAYILTAQKILQDQYERDFPEPEVVNLKGRNAYHCTHATVKSDVMANEAPCVVAGKSILPECAINCAMNEVTALRVGPESTICPYWKQVIKAARNTITMFNFSSFLFQSRINRFQKRSLAIIDEAHNIEATLLGFVEFQISEPDLAPLGLFFPRNFKTSADVLQWIEGQDLIARLGTHINDLGEKLERASSKSQRGMIIAVKEQAERLESKLQTFKKIQQDTEWIVELVDKTKYKSSVKVLSCRPVYAKAFAEDLLFKRADKILCTSATILSVNVWARNLGLDLGEVGFVRIGSTFPIENRKIVRKYVGSMSFNEKENTIPKMVAHIRDVILPKHADERGIIHAQSFDLAKRIVEGVGDDRLLLHNSGEDKADILERHASRKDSVIVAPAFHEGIDLKDDLSRFQIIAKVPFPSTVDRVVRVRMDRDPEWYAWLTSLKLVQCYGRSVRSATDWATTYVLDSTFEAFRFKNARLLPDWFKEAVV